MMLLSLNVSDLKICDLWSLESLGIKEPSISQSKSEIEEAVKEHFVRSLRRDDEGRYQMSLPWLRVHPELSDNRNIAEKRLKSCVRTLQKGNCLQEYENIFKEWVSEKIIEPVEPEELAREKGHFLPHRPIFKENSTTRILPVFDASAKERNSGTLNDCVEKGPNYLELIPKLLNRFRQGKYGVISDIRRAFLQIKVAPSDRKFLWFLWWEEGNQRKLIVYSHCRVVFGVNTSPFLLAATINYHLENVAESQKGIAAKLKESMYVDNCVASVNTIGELNSFIKISKELMASAKFDLRGWKHNRPASNEQNSILNLSSDEFREIVSVLGLKWNLYSDTLSCEIKEQNQYTISKRNVLSMLSQIFDSIGFTCPVTLVPKLILQDCWREKINWDTELPDILGKKFLKWANELSCLKDIEIPRKLPELNESATQHVFVDAS
ncbi:uncharacterized protein TNCV_3202411 [Trichonephila clavipes]|nr:uncharacterized protein TNCV_3202411 [Trichonephila clavipes]